MGRDTRPGQVIGGRYRLVSDLGSGGFGRVWKAHDATLRIDVAVKEIWLPPAVSETEQAERSARAAREARNAARLRDHPNIVAVHDVVVEDGLPWIVMRLVDGCSLEEHLFRRGPLSVDETEKVARAMLGALGAAHAAGIVHRDVKPANVMLTRSGEVQLTDFGIAVHPADTALTTTGAIVGSVPYMAPERVRGTDGLPVSDLFSLGVTLYQAVEGVSPFRRGTPTGCMAAVLFEEAPPAGRAGRLEPLITALLDKEPDRRPDTRSALALLTSPTGPGTDAARTETYTRIAGAVRALAEARVAEALRAAELLRRAAGTRPGPHDATTTPVRPPAATRTVQATRTTQTTRTIQATRTTQAAGNRPGAAVRFAGGVALVLAVAAGAVALARSGESTGDKEICDSAFESIAAFRQAHPSFTEESAKGPAETVAAARLAADLRAEEAKASDTDVKTALHNYAVITEGNFPDSTHGLMYGHLREACENVGSEP
ncbi:serine/threonine-protein kinase [Streptomyces sp. NPDC001595]|uniref:serine/threonine-protein kinase n=1 Tax=Streptomyces sp. NPDC001532 TaxID=3154520 RepID=UPI003331C0FB